MFPRLNLITTRRNEDTGRYLLLEWGWYRFTACLFVREVADWLRWQVALGLPRSIALLVFVRVAACTGESPDAIRFDTVYQAYAAGAGR